MSIAVRAVRPDDIQALAAIDSIANEKPRSLQQWQKACVGGQNAFETVVVAEQGPGLVGFTIYSLVLGEASIHDITIAIPLRGRGLGGQLLWEVLAQMRHRGARRCLLEVRESNAAARALYHRYGFSEDGRRGGYYPAAEGREDAVLMSRSL